MTEIQRVSVIPVDRPLENPFEISLGRQETARNLLVELETESGIRGFGEGSPLPPITGETRDAAVETANAGGEILEGGELRSYRPLVRTLRETFPGMDSALFALETALFDAYCRTRDVGLSELFGGARDELRTDLTIPMVSPSSARARANHAVQAGFDSLKVKTGGSVSDDVARTVAVAEAAPGVDLKVDANQGWTPKETIRFVDETHKAGVRLDLVEQPTPKADIPGLARTRDALSVPVAADESVFTPADALAIVRAEAADVINVKLGKSGLLGASEIAAIAEAANLELMIGCMLEGAVGIATSAHVAAGIGTFEYIDLDGNLLFEGVAESESFGPTISVDGPGIGVSPDEEVRSQTEVHP